jgi:hypothetical protein
VFRALWIVRVTQFDQYAERLGCLSEVIGPGSELVAVDEHRSTELVRPHHVGRVVAVVGKHPVRQGDCIVEVCDLSG